MLVQESNLETVLRNVLLFVKACSIALNLSELESLSSYGIQTEMCCLQGLCVGKS